VTCRFENFESAAHAVCRRTTNYAHSLFNKNINLCAVCSWDICLQLHFTCTLCSCTAVARAHTQLPHDNRNWTCKRLPPDSVRDSIPTEISYSQVPTFYYHKRKTAAAVADKLRDEFVQMQWRAADLETTVLPRQIWWF